MEIIKETKELDLKQNSKVEGGTEESMEIIIEQNQMGTYTQKDNGKEEERIMRRLLQDWKNLDERFIPETQKQLYKETFQKNKEKKGIVVDNQAEQTKTQGTQSMGMDSTGKGGRKRGRRTLNETIQAVGEILVNSGRVIPLSEVFQQPPKKF